MPCNSSILLGPWGGEDGVQWNYTVKCSISRISITSDADAIRSISFTSGDGLCGSDKSPVFGTPTGPPQEITIDPSVEKLVLMEGIIGIHNFIERVTQLSFTTSKNGVTTKHGPYGSQKKGTEFSCLLSEDPFSGFHGRCGEVLNSIGVTVRSRDLVDQSWGGNGGDPWSYTTPGIISHIYISYGDVVRAIWFTSVDANGREYHSKTFGDSDPKQEYHEIKIDTKAGKLNGITGTYGSYGNMTLVTSLAFTTDNQKRFGIFGTRTGIPFKYKVSTDEEVISGFYGRGGSLIDAIGVYKRQKGVLVGPIGSTGGNKWSYHPKGLISRIILTYTEINQIFNIAFESKDEFGNIDRSLVFGKDHNPNTRREIDIEGKLNEIGGTIETYSDGTFVRSLYFSTDKKIMYGPYGNQDKGAHFSIPVKDGFICGFHGASPVSTTYSLVQSIGIYVNPVSCSGVL